MKGVSAVIAIILILMIVVALAALAWTWFSGIFSSLTTEAEQTITQQQRQMSLNFALDAASCVGGNLEFTIRNTGGNDLDADVVSSFLNGVVTNALPLGGGTLVSGAVETYREAGSGCATGDTLKVTIESRLSHAVTLP